MYNNETPPFDHHSQILTQRYINLQLVDDVAGEQAIPLTDHINLSDLPHPIRIIRPGMVLPTQSNQDTMLVVIDGNNIIQYVGTA